MIERQKILVQSIKFYTGSYDQDNQIHLTTSSCICPAFSWDQRHEFGAIVKTANHDWGSHWVRASASRAATRLGCMLGCSDRYYLDSLDQKVENLMDIMRVCMCKKILSFGWILIWARFRDMPFGFFNMAVARGHFFAGVERPVTSIWTRNSMPSSSSELMALDPWAMVGRGNHPKHEFPASTGSRACRFVTQSPSGTSSFFWWHLQDSPLPSWPITNFHVWPLGSQLIWCGRQRPQITQVCKLHQDSGHHPFEGIAQHMPTP